jgi:hypothetical protein
LVIKASYFEDTILHNYRGEKKMNRTEYIVKVDTKGTQRAVILNADNELSAAKKALALFRNVELIKVEKFENPTRMALAS